jgi:hypothetical protein
MNHAGESFNQKRTASVKDMKYGELVSRLRSFHMLQLEIVEVGDGIRLGP